MIINVEAARRNRYWKSHLAVAIAPRLQPFARSPAVHWRSDSLAERRGSELSVLYATTLL
jgi:hypothetical protein